MTNDIVSRINEAIATAQMQCEDGNFHDDEWDIVISEKLHNELKEECGVVHVNSVEEVQSYKAIDIKVVPDWLLGSDVLLFVKKGVLKMMKYHSKKAKCNQGHVHDSKKEATRCNELTLLQKAGQISDLKQQVRFELIPSMKYTDMPNERACVYIADFVYFKDNVMFVEDTKGFKTPEYIIKRKLFKQKYCSDRYCGDLIIFKEL